MEATITAIKIANPSIQAWGRSSAEAVLVERIIERAAATNRIRRVMSSRACQSSSKNPGGSLVYFWFDPKVSRRVLRSSTSLEMPRWESERRPVTSQSGVEPCSLRRSISSA